MQGSWSHTSQAILEAKGVPDRPAAPDGVYDDIVAGCLRDAYTVTWRADVARHRAQVPYYLLESNPGATIQALRSAELSGETQYHLRSWCRMRCGFLCLRHLERRHSEAKYQHCIFCHDRVRNATVHVFSVCRCWDFLGLAFAAQTGLVAGDSHQKFTLAALKLGQSMDAMSIAFRWAAEVDKEQQMFWCE